MLSNPYLQREKAVQVRRGTAFHIFLRAAAENGISYVNVFKMS